MRLNFLPAGAAKAFRPGLFAILVSWAFAGCGDYCLIINSNPGGTVNTNLSCPTAKPTGNVALTFGSSFPTSESAPPGTHLVVTVRGIDARAAAMFGDDVPEWQELAPKLASQRKSISQHPPRGLAKAALSAWPACLPGSIASSACASFPIHRRFGR